MKHCTHLEGGCQKESKLAMYVLYGWVPNFKRSYAYNIAQEALVGPPPPDFGPEMIYDVSAER